MWVDVVRWGGWLDQGEMRLIMLLIIELKLSLAIKSFDFNSRWFDLPFVEGAGLYGG